MRIVEVTQTKNTPIVYVDMDGVLADLYNYAAEIHDVEHYHHMTKPQWESFFKNSNAYELFQSLPAFPSNDQLLGLVKKYAGSYNILSSPLNYDEDGSKKGKTEWIGKHIKYKPNKVIFETDKYKYATQADGTPNILIDDYRFNTDAWNKAGGIAIKYQSDEDTLDKVETVLKKIFSDK